jgi:hypothetical protein
MPPRKKNARTTARAAVIVPTVVPIPPAPAAAATISPTPVTPTATPGPTAAAANVNILRKPQRHHQLPARFRNNDADEGESFHLDNVSGDEGDEIDNSPAPAVRPAAGHSPLQTAMNTATTDHLATGGQAKAPKTSADIHFFFRQDPTTLSNICKACE